MLQGMAWDKLLGDESLFPFYQAAADLNLPICVHLGWGCPALTDIFDASTNFYSAILPVVIGFNSIMSSAAFEKIPNLRFAFLEAGAAWLPFLIKQVRRDNARQKKAKDPIEYFKTGRVFVTAEPDEDLSGYCRDHRRGFFRARLRLSARRSVAPGRYGRGVSRARGFIAAHGREDAVG